MYSGTLVATDGYKVNVFVTWRTMSAQAHLITLAADPINIGDPAVIGTCVETLDADGVALASRVTSEGNYALCHWFYYKGQSTGDPTSASKTGTAAANWGETRYLTEVEWGTSGSHITGALV